MAYSFFILNCSVSFLFFFHVHAYWAIIFSIKKQAYNIICLIIGWQTIQFECIFNRRCIAFSIKGTASTILCDFLIEINQDENV